MRRLACTRRFLRSRRPTAAIIPELDAPIKIAFFGLPLAALLLEADGHDLIYAGICRQNAIGTRRLKNVARCRVDIVPSLADANVVSELEQAAPDLIVSWFWTKKIPKRVLSLGKVGAIGVHPSLLPRHRGPDPYFWAIDSGDNETGVTAHRLDEEYDTGELIDRTTLAIDPNWNAWTLAKKLDRPSLALLRKVVGEIAKTRRIESVAQNEKGATLAPAPEESELELSFDWPAEKIVRRVRAASPWPGAFFDLAGRVLTVTQAHVTRDFPAALSRGEAALVEGHVVVRAPDAGVVIDAARDENDEILGENGLRTLFGSIVEVEKKQL